MEVMGVGIGYPWAFCSVVMSLLALATYQLGFKRLTWMPVVAMVGFDALAIYSSDAARSWLGI